MSLALASAAHGEIPKPADAPQPLTPKESKRHFALPAGFRIDLVAAEPLIRDPSCVAWDPDGRLFVTELHGYNLEGHLDVTELNKTGELDTAIRRVRVGPEMKTEAQKGQTGTLKLLRDRDGDGRMDEAITWADDLPAAYGVVAARGGVIVTAAPHILYFADTDGDDSPDVRETLFSGFAVGEMERGINNPVWGPDGWIYASGGWGGGRITGPKLGGEVGLGRSDFRFKADGSAIEPASGSNGTFGQAFDDFGNRFLLTTSRPVLYAVPLPFRYLVRNPHVATPDLTAAASNYKETFPTSKPHPWRRKRGADPRWVKFYGENEAKPNGRFTSGCGQQIYRATLFPEKYRGAFFSCDPQQNMVHRSAVTRDGPGLKARRPPEHADNEFLTSTDGWFRPTNLRVGPDGALYIVDMYREIIEDYSAIPRYLQQQYGLLNGNDRGRIWRLAPEDSEPAPIRTGSFEYSNPVAGRIADAYRGDIPELLEALDDPHYAVRVHALRATDRRLVDSRDLFEKVVDLSASESDPNVLLQLALTLGESRHPRAIPALAKLAAEHSGIRWMDSAVLSSIGDKAGPFLLAAVNEHPGMEPSIVERAAVTAARTGQGDALVAAITQLGDPLRTRLLALAAEHGVEDKESLREAADKALRQEGGSEDDRVAALKLLPYASVDVLVASLDKVLRPTEQPAFQARAVAAATSAGDPRVAKYLVARLPELSPRTRAAIVESLLSHVSSTKILLRSKADLELTDLQRYRLDNHPDKTVVAVAALRELNRVVNKREPEIDGAFREALAGKPDPANGERLFAIHCATCHQLGGKGFAVGPPLDAERAQPPESLLASILAPSTEITAGYGTFVAKTKGGAEHSGVLASESATSIALAQAAGLKTEVLRADLESLERLELSLMPANFAELLKPREVADMIAFIRARPSSTSLVLFDDDPAFPGALRDGKGRADLDWTDAASGRASLTVEGFQRYSRQLPGWAFPIRERPREGEFRYLRLAMKSRGAKGMMVELADGGSFPPEDKAIRTYYAGENSTGWTSNELAPEAPAEWRTFTIDVWKGNGEFTLTGIALTTMGGKGSYDRIELLKEQ